MWKTDFEATNVLEPSVPTKEWHTPYCVPFSLISNQCQISQHKSTCNQNENRNTFPSLCQQNVSHVLVVCSIAMPKRDMWSIEFAIYECAILYACIEKDYFHGTIYDYTCIFAFFYVYHYDIPFWNTIVSLSSTPAFSTVDKVLSVWHFMWMKTNHILMISWWHLNSFQCYGSLCSCQHHTANHTEADFSFLNSSTVVFSLWMFAQATNRMSMLWCVKHCIFALICYK